jgi:hypothetical protein
MKYLDEYDWTDVCPPVGSLNLTALEVHAERSAVMVLRHARALSPANRLRYLRAVFRMQPSTFAALRGVPPTQIHFIGFRGEEYHSAVRVFGPPDFIHRVWDVRAVSEIAPHDTAVFAKYDRLSPSPYSYDDSNQPGDPAARERIEGEG